MPRLTQEEFDKLPGETKRLTQEEFDSLPEDSTPSPPKPASQVSKPLNTAFKVADSINPDNSYSDEAAAAARGLRTGISFGWDDEIAGGVAGTADYLWNLANSSDKESFADKYQKYRDDVRAANNRSQAEHPTIYSGAKLAGNVGAGIGAGILTGGTLPAVLGTGAALGAAQGLGDSEAETVGELAQDTAVGGAIGLTGAGVGKGVSQLAGKYIAPAFRNVGQGANKLAEDLAESAAGVSSGGRELLERGVVNFGSSAKNISQNASRQLPAASEKLGQSMPGEFSENKAIYDLLQSATKAPQNKPGLPGVITDLASVAGGASSGGIPGALGGAALAGARRIAMPRLPAAGAVAADATGDLLKKVPQLAEGLLNTSTRGASSVANSAQATSSGDRLTDVLNRNPQIFGRYAVALQKSAQRGRNSLASTAYALAAHKPEFKRILEQVMNSDPEEINADNIRQE